MVTKSTAKTIPEKKPVKPKQAPKQQNARTISSEKNDIQEIIDLHTKHLLHMDEMLTSLQGELKDVRGLISSDTKSQGNTIRKKVKSKADSSWHASIDLAREYTPQEVVAITKIPSSTLSTAKGKGYIVTKIAEGKHKWVVLGSELLAWDRSRAIRTGKEPVVSAGKATPVRAEVQVKAVQTLKKPGPAKTKTPPEPKKTVRARVADPKKGVKTPSGTHAPIPEDIADRINDLTGKKKINQTQFGNEVDLPQKVIYEISTRKMKELSPEKIQKIMTVLKKYEST